MSAPDQGKNSSASAKQQDATAPGPQTSTSTKPVPVQDIIPIWLLIGIIVSVGALAFFILGDNWFSDMQRYRSMSAARNQEWQTAIDNLDKLREAGRKKDDKMVEFSPTYLSELGYAYLGLKKYEKSLEYYKLAQQYRTNMPTDDTGTPRAAVDFHNMIGLVYFRMNNLMEAEKALQEALKFNKLDPLANYTMGELAMKRGDYIKAADYFKVVANMPGYEKEVARYYGQIEDKLFANIQ